MLYSVLLLIISMISNKGFTLSDQQHVLVVLSKTNIQIAQDIGNLNRMLEMHHDNLKGFIDRGELTMIGVLAHGGGVFIASKGSFKTLKTSLEEDALFTLNYFTLEAIEFDLTQGAICSFSSDCRESIYQLVYYWPNLNKETIRIASTMEYQHQLYLNENVKKNELLLAGKFKDRDGNFIIINKPDFNTIAINDPAVSQDYFIAEFLTLTGCAVANCVDQ